MKTYDLIVIGSGGGTKISTPTARQGKRVAIIEKESFGGTCLNRGCIPSKMFIHPANRLLEARHLDKYSINHTGEFEVDFMNLANRINDEIDSDSVGIGKMYETIETLDVYQEEAVFVSDKVLRVGDEEITADIIVIATGSRPYVPNIPGLAGTPYMTSREALKPTALPKKLLIIGGGYIATELGHAYAELGSETVFFVRDQYLAREDKTIQEAFQKAFEKRHTTHYESTDLRVSYEDGIFTVTGNGPDGSKVSEQGDGLFLATGVVPDTDKLGLANTAVTCNERGYIVTNDHLETTVPGVYGIGDCIGNYLFRHSVNFEGEYLYGQLFDGHTPAPIDYPPMPHAVFSHPEIAGVGKTEQELEDEGVDYITATHSYRESAQGMARLPETGLVKLLVEPTSRRLLGAHIIGEEAATMLHQLIFAMTVNATCDDLLKMIYIHPALPEVVRNALRKALAELDN